MEMVVSVECMYYALIFFGNIWKQFKIYLRHILVLIRIIRLYDYLFQTHIRRECLGIVIVWELKLYLLKYVNAYHTLFIAL